MENYKQYLINWALPPRPAPPLQIPDSTPFDLRPYLNKPSSCECNTHTPVSRQSNLSNKSIERQHITQQQVRPSTEESDSDFLFHDSDDNANPLGNRAETIPDYESQSQGSLPPMTNYPMHLSYKEVADEINRWLAANKSGYGIVIQRSNKTVMGSLRSVTLGCDRGGEYRNNHHVTEEGRRRRYARPTRKVACPFRFQIKPGDNDSWVAKMVSDVHNHPLSEDVAEHAKQRQLFLSPEIKNEIIGMFNAKVPARKVLDELVKKYGPIPLRRKDLYNFKRTASANGHLGRSTSQSPKGSEGS